MHLTLTVDDVVDATGIAVDDWPGNCYAIAVALVESGLLPDRFEAVYGHWTGPISSRSRFADRRALGFTGHGWALDPDSGTVVDPTRWVFEHADPYIFVGQEPDPIVQLCDGCGHLSDEHDNSFMAACEFCDCELFEPEPWYYDEGGNMLAARRMGDPPTAPDVDDPDRRPLGDLPAAAAHTVTSLLADPAAGTAGVSVEQAMWLANVPYGLLGDAESVYRGLEQAGFGAFVPFDNRNRAARTAAA